MISQKKSSGIARAKSLIVLPLLCTAMLAFAETKYTSAGNQDTTQTPLKGEKVKTVDKNDTIKIDSTMTVSVKVEKGYCSLVDKGKDKATTMSMNSSNVLLVLDGKIVKTIEDIDAKKVESMKVIRDKKEMKKYGPDAEGKLFILEITLKPNK